MVDEQLLAAGRANGDGVQRRMGAFGAAVLARIFRRHYPGGGPCAAKGGSDSRMDEERTAATGKFSPGGIIAAGPARYAELPSIDGSVRERHECVPEFVAQRGATNPSIAVVDAGADYEARGGGSEFGRAVGHRRRLVSDFSEGCERKSVDAKGSAEPGNFPGSDDSAATLSGGIYLRPVCARAIGGIAVSRRRCAGAVGQSGTGLGRIPGLELVARATFVRLFFFVERGPVFFPADAHGA